MNTLTVPTVSLSLMETIFNNMNNRVGYLLGAKAPSLTCDTSEIRQIDCSGFSRYALARSSGQKLIIPDGSQNQLAWCLSEGLHRVNPYSGVQSAAQDPSRLFIAFLKPGSDGIGHVWLLRSKDGEMRTRESHGGGIGVDSRAWNNHNLASCRWCFELPAVA
jgi:hypothetical protein